MHNKNTTRQKIDINTTKATEKGLKGLFEIVLRKFSMATFVLALIPVYALGAIIVGISATPGIYFFNYIVELTAEWEKVFHYFSMGVALFVSFFIYGLCLIFVTPFFNKILPFKIKPFRGIYYSFQSGR